MSNTIKNYGVSTHQTEIHEIGNFLQSNLDLVNGSLTIEFEDFAWGGLRQPLTLKHFFHSALSGCQYSNNPSLPLNVANFSSMKIGYSWRLNLMQSLVPVDNYLIYTDENGNTTKLIPTESTEIFKGEDDETITFETIRRILTTGDCKYTFNYLNALTEIRDNNGNTIYIEYSTDDRISKITDGAGRDFIISYDDNGYLNSITRPDGTVISYAYYQNNLERIHYPDGKILFFSYNDNKLTNITLLETGIPVQQISYTYNGNKIASITELGAVDGLLEENIRNDYLYSSNNDHTIVTTTYYGNERTASKTEYLFDEKGELVNQYIHTLNYDANGNLIETPSIDVNSDIAVIKNLILNPSFENGMTNWTKFETDSTFITEVVDTTKAVTGKKELRLGKKSGTEILQNVVYQEVDIEAGEHTFSAYLRTVALSEGQRPIGRLRVTDASGSELALSQVVSINDTEHERLSVTFSVSAPTTVRVEILFRGLGYVYVDATQLEKNAFASDINFLENSDFCNDTANWLCLNATVTNEQSIDETQSLKLSGTSAYAMQEVACSNDKSTRETFTLSGWAKTSAASTANPEKYLQLRAEILYADGSIEDFKGNFSYTVTDWQFVTVEFAKTKFLSIDKLRIYCEYNVGSVAYFDNLKLVRNSVETDLNSDDFDEEETQPVTYSVRAITANDDENVEDSTETEQEESVAEDTAPAFEEVFDSAGNPLTETTFCDGDYGTIYRSFGYDSTKNNLIRETDASGNVTIYDVNETTSKNEVITNPLGNKTTYEYDNIGRTTKVTSKRADNTEISNVSYSYDSLDNLTEITRGDGMKYNLEYNRFHELESIGIEGETKNLISYTYKNAGGKIKEISYANGDKMYATYSGDGNMIAEKWYDKNNNLTAHYKYVYDKQGNIVRSIDILGAKEYNYTYEEDKLIRSAEYDITVNNDGIVTSKTNVNTIKHYYDKDGNLTKKIITRGEDEQVFYYENKEDNSDILRFSVGDKTVTSHSKTDGLGRKIFDEIQFGNGVISRKFEYVKGAITEEHRENGKIKSSPETQLVSKITYSNGRSISYFYGPDNTLCMVNDSSTGTTMYVYDELDQLVSETHNGDLVTQVTYDNYGNITWKEGSDYTYDSVWKDKLIHYSSLPITYDDQGNPIQYLNNTLEWEKGRQLKKLTQFNGKVNTYTYNANGIRTSKTIDGVRHTFELDGVKILKETWGTNTLIPLYDNEDSVCGIIYNNKSYYFLKNLQGDIIEILDGDTGNTVTRYRYNAWGVCKSVQDYSGCNIATINPFRYRGYYYDNEIQMYYLQSRYYDPNTGRFINGDAVEFLNTEMNTLCNDLYTYCYNNPVNTYDLYGNLSFSSLLSIINDCLELLLTLDHSITSYSRQFRNLDKKIKNAKTRDERKKFIKQQKKLLISKTGKGLFYVSKIICYIVIVAPFIKHVINWAKDKILFVEFIVSILLETISVVLCKMTSWLIKFIPLIGMLLGFAASFLIGKLFSRYFTDKKISRIAKYYNKNIKKLTSIEKWFFSFKYALKA